VPLATRRATPKPAIGLWQGAIAAGVALVAIGALAAWALVLRDRVDDRDRELANARDVIAALAMSAGTLKMESEYEGHTVDAVIGVPKEGSLVTVVLTGLPEAASGHGYRLWLFRDGEPQIDLSLSRDDDGNVVAQVELDLSQYDEMEVDAQSVDDDAPGGELVIGGPLR
jgi:hypothetical protein